MTDFEMVQWDDSRKVPMHRDESGERWVTNAVLAELMELTPRNVRKYIESHASELVEGVHYRYELGHRSSERGARGATDPLLWSVRGGLRASMIAKATPATIAVRNRLEDLGYADATGQPVVEVLPAVNDDHALMMQMLTTMQEEAKARQEEAKAVASRFDHGNKWVKEFESHVIYRLDRVEDQVGLGDPDDERLTGLAFCQERGLPRDKSFVIRLGTVAARLGRRDGFDERKIQNGQGIWVHSWPRAIWEKALDELGGFRLNIVS